ncbi:MAG: hypothetical protein A2939_03315 [Parcubacteria group bacterium RIFCSPLOWO2_01_FULL_48_18]|nr:MAG: hypothetical protein A3J67_02305 [Parcubacteria group bacterium RIFCSPHIGHO2_02_FULL_48_10b]OHB23418.1 MAG: hypothetical protein A2939_03315 [Parcubacteria group bacterium RIFCSPLOWO2_01_FULL_48_18]
MAKDIELENSEKAVYDGGNKREKEERLMDLAQRLEEISPEDSSAPRLMAEFLAAFAEAFYVTLSSDVDALYKEMEEKKFLLRLESVKRITECLIKKAPLELGGGKKRYANAVTVEGLRIAFAEGDAPGPIRLLVGFDSAIGFDARGLKVEDIEMEEDDPRDARFRIAYCRHVSGNLPPERIKYFIVRIPEYMFPPELLTDEERRGGGKFMFRGARFNQ